MRIQLWSYNYSPEPQGIGPLSHALAGALKGNGHTVTVVAAHPHYPDAKWGTAMRPYREMQNGVKVLRLPLWIGRGTGLQRIRQEASFAAGLALMSPLLPRADVLIAVSPCLPALAPVMAISRAKNVPWLLWLQDIVSYGAETSGLLSNRGVLRSIRSFEEIAFRASDRVVVISKSFAEQLRTRGVPPSKIARIYNPLTRPADSRVDPTDNLQPPVMLVMGNIGFSQGIDDLIDAFQSSAALRRLSAELVIAGTGVAAEAARERIRDPRVRMTGVLYGDELTAVLEKAALGIVCQRPGLIEFNFPSKIMNYMASGLPILASVDPQSETKRILASSGAGWSTNSDNLSSFTELAAEKLARPADLTKASVAGFEFAQSHFRPAATAHDFEDVIRDVIDQHRSTRLK
jgi:colanic acid biosynthesis glycosyl transferase WcaI